MAAKILTANKLGDGRVVWYSKNGQWSEDANNALLAVTPEETSILEDAQKLGLATNIVIDANLIDVDEKDAHLRPIRLRERIRQNGPTIAYGAAPLNP
ncbi:MULTISPECIES: DUF2849 domain-containing protein [unclassified Bartonella]|uniref:DUF2849 domain-containing protein n=1 Tax=unclassified Bartonella TaxID=2645622 RepID=UPI0021C87F03|nr:MULTISPECIES: DUF2849 domain-containing protein [unclassified Bartonella]UXM94547.1 DUF2849 domain-containing protein [Bartonella sp. HY329]UXN02563.1 DUF2849 domain-containing protein [Bartonella sp. HY406]UXN08871.1 DUF2849 domain-containing protein [Bartonella sp. HY328]